MEEPRLQDFGIKPEEYALYVGRDDSCYEYFLPAFLGTVVVVGLIASSIGYLTGGSVGGAIGLGIAAGALSYLTGGAGVPLLTVAAIRRLKRPRLLKSPVASQIKLYEEERHIYAIVQSLREAVRQKEEEERQEAERARREAETARWRAEEAKLRGIRDHWMSLSGEEFERELGALYQHLGFSVELTPRSGDQGIDLILRKHGKTTVVQCKAHRSPIGPAAARELFGSMRASGANSAILACTGGFTRGAIEFVQGKPITLLSGIELATMGENALERTTRPDLRARHHPPRCPVPGCGQPMVPRKGRYGRFWGCRRYPECKGTRYGTSALPPH